MKIVLLSLMLVLAGCSSTQTSTETTAAVANSDTMEIIRRAAEQAPRGVLGEYVLHIKATGSQGPFVYLNTELDYRDPRAITVALSPNLIPRLEDKYGASPQEFFTDKTVKVIGKATRVRIDFISEGKRTEKYYYQTHIRLVDISKIEVVDKSV
ncbi:hypothetical protein Q4561_18055 [Alteromonas sp. 1_MG-2023]|uniref:hypothetical protein n=1 Tax=Alteromonas sp. 1_MG-2023 TaxID=3062669 RepID=UPI0026E15CC5|nr:hypothetical protein [Alteromonas sp. 1_MG-2023]MDO6568981.1 hypothetical protein [Alteromonas sp. 1_MG-2023]